MNTVAQPLKFSSIDFGIFWDFPQDGLPAVSGSQPVFMPIFCRSESAV